MILIRDINLSYIRLFIMSTYSGEQNGWHCWWVLFDRFISCGRGRVYVGVAYVLGVAVIVVETFVCNVFKTVLSTCLSFFLHQYQRCSQVFDASWKKKVSACCALPKFKRFITLFCLSPDISVITRLQCIFNSAEVVAGLPILWSHEFG